MRAGAYWKRTEGCHSGSRYPHAGGGLLKQLPQCPTGGFTGYPPNYPLPYLAFLKGVNITQEEKDAFFDPMIAKKPGKPVYMGYWDGFKFS